MTSIGHSKESNFELHSLVSSSSTSAVPSSIDLIKGVDAHSTVDVCFGICFNAPSSDLIETKPTLRRMSIDATGDVVRCSLSLLFKLEGADMTLVAAMTSVADIEGSCSGMKMARFMPQPGSTPYHCPFALDTGVALISCGSINTS